MCSEHMINRRRYINHNNDCPNKEEEYSTVPGTVQLLSIVYPMNTTMISV